MGVGLRAGIDLQIIPLPLTVVAIHKTKKRYRSAWCCPPSAEQAPRPDLCVTCPTIRLPHVHSKQRPPQPATVGVVPDLPVPDRDTKSRNTEFPGRRPSATEAARRP
jgi:hypothetical protein